VKSSFGILMYRKAPGGVQVLLAHPGGPFWARKHAGVWSIPKGEPEEGEDPLGAARREFEEETGAAVTGQFEDLGEIRQPSGKVVRVWAVEGDFDPAELVSSTFSMEWPPRSGTMREFPEVDRAAWFGVDEAREAIVRGQAGFLDRLLARLREEGSVTAGRA